MKTNSNSLVKALVKLRMFYADMRGHHGKRWDYEPGDHYLGMKQSKKYKASRALRQEGSTTSYKVL